ncbi:MAG: oligoribonuclease [Elusimicrobia bacterium RIFCSPLOWO2_01_FULL_59_12]|nr:MAG: oligoribonuclease [Elusimicrobia bacterium RIFCSPLOWO2_01_FULL_59_12]
MSGLDPDRHAILEIGCAVTDSQLHVIAEGPVFAIHQSSRVLARMDPWCVKQHGRSGLTRRVRESRVRLAQAERRTLAFLRTYCKPQKSPLCGNSIGQDRRFLQRYMPRLNAFFHYRNVDVSSIKELVKRWYPAKDQAPPKSGSHHVLDDVRESIAELKHYRRSVFR